MEILHFATLSQIKNIITAVSHRFKKIDKRIDSLPEWTKQPNKPTYTATEVGALPSDTHIPTKTSDLTNDSGFITGYTETDPTVPSWAKQQTKPTYTAQEVGALPSDTVIPSKTSQLQNDSGFLTEHQNLDTYATKQYVDNVVGDVESLLASI